MKKLVVALFLVIIFIVAGVFFLESEQEIEPELVIRDVDISKLATKKKIQETTDQINPQDKKQFTQQEAQEHLEEWEEVFDRIESEFNKEIKTLFVKRLNLTEATFTEYLKMREGMENDKIRAMDAFHKEMERKFGPNYSYNPTEEEIKFGDEIRKRYEKTLMDLIGKENFIQYLEARDRYNESLMENQDPEKGVILMEF